MKEYSLFEEHSSNLYRGRTQAIVSVIKMDEDRKNGRVIYSKDLVSRYPISTPKSVDEIPYAQFKKLYLSRLSEEVGILCYEHFAEMKFPPRAVGPQRIGWRNAGLALSGRGFLRFLYGVSFRDLRPDSPGVYNGSQPGHAVVPVFRCASGPTACFA